MCFLPIFTIMGGSVRFYRSIPLILMKKGEKSNEKSV